uniref:CCHC-type domain-containing protein n=1 Tax=Chelydra serpentina TaxID=8475 RepID=A0A8C3SJA3_CHESE
MGSGQSIYAGTPLECMLNNWKAFRRQADYGMPLCKDALIKFCTVEWPTFGVGWPAGGTLKLKIVEAVHNVVTRDGHWDQYPYIDIWQDLTANPPPWLQECRAQAIRALMAQTPGQPVIPTAPDPMPPPPVYPGLPASPAQPLVVSPVVNKNTAEIDPTLELPLRETVGPTGDLTMIYVPFTTSDLYNWKHQNPSFSEDPAPLTAVFETLVSAHNPTWGDMKIALNTLLTAEERRLVFSKAKEGLVAGGVDAADVPTMLPETAPNWPHTDAENRGYHHRYALAIVQGMKRCIRKTPNWAKLYNIRQEKNENPAAFYERLCNTCKRYTDLDPEDVNGKRVLIPLFIGQSYEDIRKKLQKIDGASGKNIEELLEIALKIYDRRDDEERKKGARLLAMALKGESGKGGANTKGQTGVQEKGRGSRLGRNQCAICKEEGHWKNECPQRHNRREGKSQKLFAFEWEDPD